MRLIRRLIYRLGFSPKPGSIFFSPSTALLNILKEHPPHEAFIKGMGDMEAYYRLVSQGEKKVVKLCKPCGDYTCPIDIMISEDCPCCRDNHGD